MYVCTVQAYYPMTVFAYIFLCVLSLQYTSLATHYRYVGILVCVVMILVEAGRLYLAYEGNLKEKVSTHMPPFLKFTSKCNCVKFTPACRIHGQWYLMHTIACVL